MGYHSAGAAVWLDATQLAGYGWLVRELACLLHGWLASQLAGGVPTQELSKKTNP